MIPADFARLRQQMTPRARIDATWRRRSAGESVGSVHVGMGRLPVRPMRHHNARGRDPLSVMYAVHKEDVRESAGAGNANGRR